MPAPHSSHHPARTPLCPSLPPEVWIHIFRYTTDPAHLWLTCRRVSSALRACAEHAFGQYFLRDVSIDFALERYNLGGSSRRPEVNVRFERLGVGAEKGVVWFRCGEGGLSIGEWSGGGRGRNRAVVSEKEVLRRWEENVEAWRAEMPHYTMSIGGYVNDTELPGLAIDTARREVSFRWKDMLHLFFREVAALQRRREKWQNDTTRILRANAARATNSASLTPPEITPPQWPTAELAFRKQIRRARLKESYAGNEEMLWAIGSLAYLDERAGAAGTKRGMKLDAVPSGAGLGERWFGRAHLVQGLFLDEWSCLQRIEVKAEERRGEEGKCIWCYFRRRECICQLVYPTNLGTRSG